MPDEGNAAAPGGDNPEQQPDNVEKKDEFEGLTPEQIEKKKKEKNLRALFDQFDQNPKDDKLDKAEFKLCMNKIAGAELRDDVVKAAFDRVDLDHSGDIDFDEFQKGYQLIEQYAKDKPAQTATRAMDVAQAVSPAASTAASMAKAVTDAVHVDLKTKTEPTETTSLKSQAGDSGEPADAEVQQLSSNDAFQLQAALSGMVAGAVCLTACAVVATVTPAIAFWIAVGSGESCDVPLDTWCWGMAITCTITLLVQIFQVQRAMAAGNAAQQNGGFQMLNADAQPQLDANSGPYGCIGLFNLIWAIIGLYWFCQAGFLAGGKGNCEKVAPTVFTIVWWYWLLSIIFLSTICVLCCCMVICMIAFGSAASISMKGQRS